jgi:hypothetical protein
MEAFEKVCVRLKVWHAILAITEGSNKLGHQQDY